MTAKTDSKKKTHSYKGKEYTRVELAKLSGRSTSNINLLMKKGWSVIDIVETPTRQPVLYEHEGMTLSVKELSKLCDVPEVTLATRLRLGWTVERATAEIVRKKTAKRYLYNGKKYSIAELSKISGFTYNLIMKRLNDGWSVEKAVETSVDKGILYDYKGKLLTVSQLARLSDLKGAAHESLVRLINDRISSGWLVEEAVDTPKNKTIPSSIK